MAVCSKKSSLKNNIERCPPVWKTIIIRYRTISFHTKFEFEKKIMGNDYVLSIVGIPYD